MADKIIIGWKINFAQFTLSASSLVHEFVICVMHLFVFFNSFIRILIAKWTSIAKVFLIFMIGPDMLMEFYRSSKKAGTDSTFPWLLPIKGKVHHCPCFFFHQYTWFPFGFCFSSLIWNELKIRFFIFIIGIRIIWNYHWLWYFRRSISEKLFDLSQRLVRRCSLVSRWLNWCWWKCQWCSK